MENRVTILEHCIVALLAGMALGGIFFGGLWLTIRHTLSSAALGLWLMGSFVVRTVIVLVGFYVIFAGDWRRLIACLVGFASARFVVAGLLGARKRYERATVPKGFHAP
jgi:F1F0 ATPase subunit 2